MSFPSSPHDPWYADEAESAQAAPEPEDNWTITQAPPTAEELAGLCGAQDWAPDEDEENGVRLYGTCGLPKGHEERFHVEMRDGSLWASWSGDRAERAPASIDFHLE